MRRVEKVCDFCKDTFSVPRCQSHQQYCSKDCYHSSRRPYVDELGNMVKRCSTCGSTKTLTDFSQAKDKRSGYQTRCKTCESKSQKAVYEKVSVTEDFKRKLHKDNRTVRRRFWKGKHSAKKRSYVWNLSLEQYEILVKHPCHYCGKPIDDAGVGLDRKDNGTIYSETDCVSCCGRCNSTFMANFNYAEKMQLAVVIRQIDQNRA